MLDETTTMTGENGDAIQTEMETITLNNRTITVPKSAVEILKDAESNMTRGFQDKLTKEREKIDQDRAEDVEFYRTHDQSIWNSYDPKIYGGKGFTGDESLLTTKKNEPVITPTNGKPNISFGEDARLKQLEREFAEQKKTIEYLQKSEMNRCETQVKQDRDNLLTKYPYTDIISVNESLRNFWVNNQRHPLKTEIESIMKRNNDFVAVKVATAKQEMIPKQTATPSASGTSPLSKKDKLPKFEDVDGWVKLAHEDMTV